MAHLHTQVGSICGSLDDAELVAMCNMMMAAAGLIAKAQIAEDVLAICSSTSVFVAAFEQLTGKRIRNVQRSPKSTADRIENCSRVIQETAELFKLDLSHLSAERIVLGDKSQTVSLLELMVAIPKQRFDDGSRDLNGAKRTAKSDRSRREDANQPSASVQSAEAGEGFESPSKHVTRQVRLVHWSAARKDSDSGFSSEGSSSRSHETTSNIEGGKPSRRPQQAQVGKGASLRGRAYRPEEGSANEIRGRDRCAQESVPDPTWDSAERDSDSADSFSSASPEHGKPNHFRPDQAAGSTAKLREKVLSWGQSRPPTSVHFQPNLSSEAHSGKASQRSTRKTSSRVSGQQGDVSKRRNDVSRVLSLVERVVREEQHEWEHKQAAFARQLQSISRRAYAPRWPFRPLPDAPKKRIAQADVRHRWRELETERLRKRRKRLVVLPPLAGVQGGAGTARCRKAYRSFLPGGQVSLRFRPEPKPATRKADRLFSKETVKQLNDVIHSPISTLDGGRALAPNLKTLLRKHPKLQQLLVGPRSKTDGPQPAELVESLPLNPGFKKGLADKLVGLRALKQGAEAKSKTGGVSDEATWRHVEAWAEGLVPRSQSKMRASARARLRGRLEAHQQRLRQLRAERFREEAEADQKAAAAKRAAAEERLFKALLEKALALERESILVQRKEERERNAAEQRNARAEKERAAAEIRARCALLKEEIQAKRRERMEIERAQEQVMRQLGREERERLEYERAMLLERLSVQAR